VTDVDGGGGIENVGFDDRGDIPGRNEVLACGIEGYKPVCSRIAGGPITWGEEVLLEEALLWEAGTEYGAGPGSGALRRGRFGSGESLNQQSAQARKGEDTNHRVEGRRESEASRLETARTLSRTHSTLNSTASKDLPTSTHKSWTLCVKCLGFHGRPISSRKFSNFPDCPSSPHGKHIVNGQYEHPTS